MSVDELLEKTSRTLSGLSRCASLVLSPASNAELQHFEFVPLGENRALAVLVMRGQSNLLDDIQAGEELETIGQLFDELEARENALRLFDAISEGDGVKIFIGAENKLFTNAGCSMVIAPYHDSKKQVIGTITAVLS